MFYRTVLRPLLFQFPPERTHHLILELGKKINKQPYLQRLVHLLYHYHNPGLVQNLWGLHFPNPLGLAAGFDKNGELCKAVEAMGFGFTEIGSITAKPSPGNPKPRLFRLTRDHSLINRMGLNNDGADTIKARLSQMQPNIPLGVNIAKTNEPSILGDKAIDDYKFSYNRVRNIADYITLNISCPNTAKGKTFEDPKALAELLSALDIKHEAGSLPTLVKFSVDLKNKKIDELISVCEEHHINGYVATNTSQQRKNLFTPPETLENIGDGGLSGQSIRQRSTHVIDRIYKNIRGRKPIIGVGGIDCFEAALEKLRAGADLLQIYTGLIYRGPSLLKSINRQLSQYLDEHNLKSVRQIRQS